MVKTLLVYPRFGWELDIIHPHPPLGIAYIASFLRQNNCDVRIRDMTFDNSIENIQSLIHSFSPDIIGIQILSANLNNAKIVAKLAKKIKPDSLVVAGGPHPTVLQDEVISIDEIDAVVIGEGELTLLDLVRAVESGSSLSAVDGIYFKENGSVVKNRPRDGIEDLDALPFPARDLLPMEKYLSIIPIEPTPAPSTSIVTSRGCVFKCHFCHPISLKLFGHKIRRRSPKNIVDEIATLVNKYKLRGFEIVDDLFAMNDRYVQEFCDGLIDRGLKLKWRCNSRIDTLSPEMLSAMKKAGCIALIFGVESGSQRMLDLMNKKITVEETKKAFRLCKEARISAMANILIGYPGETKESLTETVNLISEIKPEMLSLNVATPMPGTDLHDMVKREGKLKVQSPSDYRRDFYGGIELDNVTETELMYYAKKAYEAFYKTLFPRIFIERYFLYSMMYRIGTLLGKPLALMRVIRDYMIRLILRVGHKRR